MRQIGMNDNSWPTAGADAPCGRPAGSLANIPCWIKLDHRLSAEPILTSPNLPLWSAPLMDPCADALGPEPLRDSKACLNKCGRGCVLMCLDVMTDKDGSYIG